MQWPLPCGVMATLSYLLLEGESSSPGIFVELESIKGNKMLSFSDLLEEFFFGTADELDILGPVKRVN